MRKKIRYAIIGVGHIGKRHLEIVINHPHFELVALCDVYNKPDINKEVHFFKTIDELINSSLDIDVVCIATPNGYHENYSIELLKAGYHVIIEKPMALSLTGVQNIQKVALKFNKKVFTVLQNRFSENCIRIKDALNKDLIGNVFMVQLNCYWNRNADYYIKSHWHGTKDLDGGILFTQFSHYIDLLYWFFGDIENISGRSRNFKHQDITEFDDSGVIQFDLKNGGIGCLNFSTAIHSKNYETSLTVFGEKGYIKISGSYMEELSSDINDLIEEDSIRHFQENHYNQCNHKLFYDHVCNRLNATSKHSPEEDKFHDGSKVVDIIERMYTALQTEKSNSKQDDKISLESYIKSGV